jgi:transposase
MGSAIHELRACGICLLEPRLSCATPAKKALLARKDDVCKRLMTISGVGPIVSLSFKATIDDPNRFKDSRAVAAHLGLTPRVYQSGEIDRSGNISKCGDKMMRHALYEAAEAVSGNDRYPKGGDASRLRSQACARE